MAAQRRLNRDELVATATAVADEEGLDAVTIRRVAQSHDVTPMALYRHFADKEGLLDAIAERLLDDVAAVPHDPRRPWHEELHALLDAILAAVRPHPNLSPLLFTRMFLCESGRMLTERTLALLADGGMPVQQAAETACQILSSLVSLVVTEPGRVHGPDPDAHEALLRAKRAALLALDPARYPHLVASAFALTECASGDAYYARGVAMIVTGIRGNAADAAALPA
jgi:AcrR family transcriptional regulator